jgi:hypothetical protein
MEKSLDRKIDALLANPSAGDFILADAKDADMAMGLAAPGVDASSGRGRTLQDYRELVRQNVEQALIDIMLVSCSTLDALAAKERLFDDSPVTPAIRANDATDIWMVADGSYTSAPSRPFRTAVLNQAMYDGQPASSRDDKPPKTDLGLYSITLNNCLERDLESLNAYGAFRVEAAPLGFRHFLEVFNPNKLVNPVADVPRFVNDSIARLLAGVSACSRPLFLKVAYNGPAAMEQLASYDANLIVGILGGSSGTTFDAFHQLWEARKYGARAALYGRMINHSEHQPTFIQHLRWLADGDLNDASEAVRSYHATLKKLDIPPKRTLEDDLVSTRRVATYTPG